MRDCVDTSSRPGCRTWIRIGSGRAASTPSPTVHDTGREILDQYVRFCGQRLCGSHGLRVLEVENDALFRLAKHRVQFGGSAGVSAAGRFDLDDFGTHRSQIACGRRPGDDPAEIEHTNAGERHRPRQSAVLTRRGGDLQPEGRPGRPYRSSTNLEWPPEVAVSELRRIELLGRLAQRKTRHVRCLGLGPAIHVCWRATGGSIATSSHRAHPNLQCGRFWSQTADRCPNRAKPMTSSHAAH